MALPPPPDNLIPEDRRPFDQTRTQYFDLGIDADPDGISMEETPDGSLIVNLEPPPPERPVADGFYQNLADVLPRSVRERIALDLVRAIEIDIEALKDRDKQYEEGIKRTGMGNEAPGGAAFEGASRAVHPMITEAAIDYQSRIVREMLPIAGPVKPKVIGTSTKAKAERAARITEHMNYQITNEIVDARTTMEVMFGQVPLGGSQFIRQTWDHGANRPRWQFVPVDKVIVQSTASSFHSARRRGFLDVIDAIEFRQRVANGVYRDIGIGLDASMPVEPTRSEAAARKVEGTDDTIDNIDSQRELYEVMVDVEADAEMCGCLPEDPDGEEEGVVYPYLVTIDKQTNEMVAMYRDWERGDKAREPIEHMFEFQFVPWRGPYAIGLPQIMGGLSGAATGALRALLDSAHVNNVPAGVALKGSGTSGQTRMPSPGQILEMGASLEADDIRKRVMPLPFNPPSTVLFQLLGFVVEASRGLVRTTMETSPVEGGAPVPVGTQMSRVEEGLVVFSSIHARAHAAMDRLLRGLHRLNRLYLPDEVKIGDGEILVRRSDYDGFPDVVPVSDPTIWSDLQRFRQLEWIQNRQLVNPPLWNARQIELAGLKLIRWPDPESLLAPNPEPEDVNAVTENTYICLGRAVAVFPNQNHLAHIQAHMDFLKSPALGGNPIIGPRFLPGAVAHIADHIVQFYAEHTEALISGATSVPMELLMVPQPQIRSRFDELVAKAAATSVQDVEQALAAALPILAQAAQQMQQMMPKQPLDPVQGALQAATQETQRKAADDQMSQQLKTAELQQKQAAEDRKAQVEAGKIVQKAREAELKAQTEIEATLIDSDTALEITKQKIAAGEGSRFSTGNSLASKH